MNSMTLTITLFIALLTYSAQATAQTFESQIRQVNLLELYTSEGCHSCPWADAWLSKRRSKPGLWKTFVPVGFHVDYWDYLGWGDVLSDSDYSQRQRSLASRWPKPSVYTPGFILNANEFRVSQVKLLTKLGPPAGKLTASGNGSRSFKVEFKPTKDAGSYRLFSSLLTLGTRTNVKSGENKGKVLKHDFGVCKFDVRPLQKIKGRYYATVKLKNCKNPKFTKKAKAAAFWVSAGKGVTPIQAVGGYLK